LRCELFFSELWIYLCWLVGWLFYFIFLLLSPPLGLFLSHPIIPANRYFHGFSVFYLLPTTLHSHSAFLWLHFRPLDIYTFTCLYAHSHFLLVVIIPTLSLYRVASDIWNKSFFVSYFFVTPNPNLSPAFILSTRSLDSRVFITDLGRCLCAGRQAEVQ